MKTISACFKISNVLLQMVEPLAKKRSGATSWEHVLPTLEKISGATSKRRVVNGSGSRIFEKRLYLYL
jgi:hypothetical protein